MSHGGVLYKFTDVSEERTVFIFKVESYQNKQFLEAVCLGYLRYWRGGGGAEIYSETLVNFYQISHLKYQKMVFLIFAAVRTSSTAKL
jgi:hypothetical protein